jgi:competence protein ComEC
LEDEKARQPQKVRSRRDGSGQSQTVRSGLSLPDGCKAQVFDERRLALTGAVGLTWDGARFAVATDRSALEDRPWSPAPKRVLTDRVVRPGQGGSRGADPADGAAEPGDER